MIRAIKDFLLRTQRGQRDERAAVKVLVALRMAEPDEACLDRLRDLGLEIDKVIGNKLVGSIEQAGMAALKAHADVAEIEPSAPVKLHT